MTCQFRGISLPQDSWWGCWALQRSSHDCPWWFSLTDYWNLFLWWGCLCCMCSQEPLIAWPAWRSTWLTQHRSAFWPYRLLCSECIGPRKGQVRQAVSGIQGDSCFLLHFPLGSIRPFSLQADAGSPWRFGSAGHNSLMGKKVILHNIQSKVLRGCRSPWLSNNRRSSGSSRCLFHICSFGPCRPSIFPAHFSWIHECF
jgi:hypothetical protein